jgi:hypothetical protein
MMRELWVEYVTGDPSSKTEPGCAEAGLAEFELAQPQAETPRTGVLLLMETPKVTVPPCVYDHVAA